LGLGGGETLPLYGTNCQIRSYLEIQKTLELADDIPSARMMDVLFGSPATNTVVDDLMMLLWEESLSKKSRRALLVGYSTRTCRTSLS